MKDQQPRHVFISYVRENKKEVDRLCQDLERHGVKIWLDWKSIAPGSDFRNAIRDAIQEGHFFIACFSKEYTTRTLTDGKKTYMKEELTIAIDELRQYTRPWLIPVKLSECEVPNLRISADKTLKHLQYVELYKDWDAGIQDILSEIKPTPVSIQNLLSALRSEDRAVRAHAARALGQFGPEAKTAVPALIEALKDKDEMVRSTAASALGCIGPAAKVAVPALIEALNKDGALRYPPAGALEKINTPEAQKALEEYKKKSN